MYEIYIKRCSDKDLVRFEVRILLYVFNLIFMIYKAMVIMEGIL